MVSKAEKLLEKMRNNKKGWKRSDLETLYKGFGFSIETSRGPHDKVFHEQYPELITVLPRHKKLAQYIVAQAVKMIDRLKALEQDKEDSENE